MKDSEIIFVGWFGRASEFNHRAKVTQTHAVRNGNIPLCNYRPHSTMTFQWCSRYKSEDWVECPSCTKIVNELKRKFLSDKFNK